MKRRKLNMAKILLLILLLWNCYLTIVVNDILDKQQVKVPILESNETLNKFVVLDLENILKRN